MRLRRQAARAAPAATVAAALLAAGSLLVAGCGGDDGDGEQPGTTSTGAVTTAGAEGVELEEIGTFEEPLYVTQPQGSEDLYVVERGGRVKIVRNGETLPQPFLDIASQVSTEVEQGLLSIAFAPDYEESGLFYAYYTGSGGEQRVVELRRSGDDPDRAEQEERLLLAMPDFAPNHNGGLVVFGLDDKLYIGTGDGGGAGDPRRNGQNRDTLLGKILRIDPKASGDLPYTVPDDNPFVGESGVRPEIYSYGLRNPWRFTFDPDTGALLIADVGQDEQEEVDIVAEDEGSGANFGWSALEGTSPFNEDQSAPGAVEPALTYGRDRGCSITGGYVIRDPELPAMDGRYVYGDFCEPALRSFELSETEARDERPLGVEVPAISSFGLDNAGHVYVTSFEGPVYRLVASE